MHQNVPQEGSKRVIQGKVKVLVGLKKFSLANNVAWFMVQIYGKSR